MSTATLDKPELRIKAPELRGAALALGRTHDTEVGLDGPAGTGKTLAILYYIHILLLKYPGAKWLVTRRYNTDLAGSAMATYQNDVLNESEGVRYFGGSRVKPPGYIYPNGSFLAVSGLDRPSRLKSFECDGVYINEATEIDVEHLEYARMRLRKGIVPWQQIVMDFNPDAPTHWLNQRLNEGTTTRLLSRHEDNPRYFDTATQDWTEDGRRYIEGILGGLTGVRLARYRYGIWAAAEGTVYEDAWDARYNVVDTWLGYDKDHIPAEWPRYHGVDFGFTNPFCYLWAALDPDGRIVIYRQIYRTKRLVEDHAVDIKRYSKWGEKDGDPLPREIICDHDAEGRETLTRHLGFHTIAAHKNVLDGIQAMATRLKRAGDGKPRFVVFRNSLVERDPELAQQKKPTCLEEEPDVYVWKVGSDGNPKAKEEPVKEYDHALDPARYLVARFDLRPLSVGYSSRVY
jgi:PBSX family phage terminase large subunit